MRIRVSPFFSIGFQWCLIELFPSLKLRKISVGSLWSFKALLKEVFYVGVVEKQDMMRIRSGRDSRQPACTYSRGICMGTELHNSLLIWVSLT